MVKDTRKATGSGDIRPLNEPFALPVKVGNKGSPMAAKLRGRWLEVESVLDRWRIDEEWWRDEPVSRTYFACIVDGGIRVTVFQELDTQQWYGQKI